MAGRYVFNVDQLTKEAPPGTCFLGPVQYDRTFLTIEYDISFHGNHFKLLNMEKDSMFSAMLCEGSIFLGI